MSSVQPAHLEPGLRFMLFAGDNYYPRGGMNDCKRSDSDLDSLVDYARVEFTQEKDCWWHVYDVEVMEIVAADLEHCQNCFTYINITTQSHGMHGCRYCDDCMLLLTRKVINDMADYLARQKPEGTVVELSSYLHEKLGVAVDFNRKDATKI
jgi:hypothetical protein